MSHEIKNEAIELSADELDVVAGGGASLVEFANFFAEKNVINSALVNGPGGSQSLTQVVQEKVDSSAGKSVFSF
ncbi:CTB family bacteriocin [Calothrix sp. PCC 6303]|uniref:CTB family bacteriocin n=1 Tax=Calothrix sp. PCC 6303 TaxID=1170562 RepID=UPI0002A0041F|nr:CTB family bacteriocin [Calothrix sp. PCC 6303]AFZ00899.1 hypothetical protein Cal6303_1865 [Calothrix sp. PCC 6303]AFZ00903.1 hypothetical protein Cal6303_1869 [Calothrix sp. PCC 6303]